MRRIRQAMMAPIAATLLVCVACGGEYAGGEPSPPPPYAPAYGYRYHHPSDHVLLIYDPDLAIYRVSGYQDIYFRNGTYYRLRDGGWYHASHIRGHWTSVGYASIPPGLQHKYKNTVKYKEQNSHAAKSNEPGMHAKKHYKRGKKGG